MYRGGFFVVDRCIATIPDFVERAVTGKTIFSGQEKKRCLVMKLTRSEQTIGYLLKNPSQR